MLLLALACLTPRQVDQLIVSNAELATALTTSQTELAECQTSLAQAPAQLSYAEQELAQDILREVYDALGVGDTATAKSLMATLMDEHGESKAAQGAYRIARELEVVGSDAPSLDQVDWWQGDYDPNAKATLFIFWEEWCPHCRRELPKANETWELYKDQGLQVVGLTRVTKSSSEENAKAFVEEEGIGFVIGKEKGDVSDAFAVRGIPAAAVVQDGRVVWRGHPGRLKEEAFALWLN